MIDQTPIIVQVRDGFWSASSINSEITERDRMLLELIQEVDGVSEDVEPGDYTFNLIQARGRIHLVELLPLKK